MAADIVSIGDSWLSSAIKDWLIEPIKNVEEHHWFNNLSNKWKMARLNVVLSLFDAILIVPMFQIAWTFFSICTGFVYFQEYQVLNALRITMFIIGMTFVFIVISLLAPDDFKGVETKDSSLPTTNPSLPTDTNRIDESGGRDMRSMAQTVLTKVKSVITKAKAACSLSLGLGEETLGASSVLVMPMVSSRTTGFRENVFDRVKLNPMQGSNWINSSEDEEYDDEVDMMETKSLLS